MFPGINPFLNTFLKQRGVWPDFHSLYIGDVVKTLRAALVPLGYDVFSEEGLQIRTEVREAVHLLTLEQDDRYPAIKIYDAAGGELLVWIELLSPSNKPPNSNFDAYDSKRTQVIQAGTVFVELDFIHWLAPTWHNTPAYAGSDDGAAPYRITVIDPHPTALEGTGYGYPFGVLDPVPTVSFPLRDRAWFAFDFGAPYHKTFTEALYDQLIGDALAGYTDADAERIRAFVADAT